jgi:hypothetical protein
VDVRGIAATLVPLDWRYEGRLKFQTETEVIEGADKSFIALNSGSSKDSGHIYAEGRSFEEHYEANGRLVIASSTVRAVDEYAFCYSSPTNRDASRLKVRLRGLLVDSIDTASVTRETALGMSLSDWPLQVNTEAFGRRAVLSNRRLESESDSDAIELIYEGNPFSSGERAALHDVVRFICGVRGGAWFVECFNERSARVGFKCELRGRIKLFSQHLRPINAVTQNEALAESFPTMLTEMLELRNRKAPAVSAMIHHYNDASVQTYPTSQLRDLAVAVESLFVAFTGRQSGRTPMAHVPDFGERMRPVLASFEAAFAGVADHEARSELDRIRDKIRYANLISPRQELFALLESLDIGFGKLDRDLIGGYRNGILHSGYYGDESDLDDLRENAKASNEYANLFHRAVLRKLGFSGQYRDARTRESFNLCDAPSYRDAKKKKNKSGEASGVTEAASGEKE